MSLSGRFIMNCKQKEDNLLATIDISDSFLIMAFIQSIFLQKKVYFVLKLNHRDLPN